MLQGTLTGLTLTFILLAVLLIVVLWWGRGWFVQWLKGSAGFILLALTVVAVFMLVDIWSYRQLLKEEPLATVSVYQLDDQAFDLTLVDGDNNEHRYKILGDQWQLDVRLLVWKGPFTAMGAMPLYRLDRLSGRYLSLEQERTAQRSVYSLTESRWFDLWEALRGHGAWLEAESGQAVYMPLVNGAVFAVHLTPKGLIARPMNDVAETALQGNW
ncbi:MAG: cation/multidrug efflux pump [Pseudomonadota bacterium]|nr:cation/multidrug efflux pump [Pseudomonadota bacterium]